MKYLSLCLPTNGISEWVFPVLDKIYTQEADVNEWELIVTDNGSNEDFSNRMKEYTAAHENLVYKKTEAYLFENQIEALRLAEGLFLKFINHRSILEQGALQWMIYLVKKNMNDKPVIYLSNGVLRYREQGDYASFDEFVRGLREYASWTTGVGVWKSDFDSIPRDWIYNKISPHSDVLFWVRDRERYIIDDRKWCHDIEMDHSKKGKYDLYRAFAVEEISITLSLLNDRSITPNTFKYVVSCYEKFVANLFYDFNISRQPCSYILDGFNDSMGIFLSKRRVLLRAYSRIFIMAAVKVYRMIWRKGKNS